MLITRKIHYNLKRPIQRGCHVTSESRDFQTRVEKLLKIDENRHFDLFDYF